MKYLFVTLLCVMIVATVITIIRSPDMQSDIPVLYWVTDANPARLRQIDVFHKWLIKNGHFDERTLTTMQDVEKFRNFKLMPNIKDAIVSFQPEAAKVWDGTIGESDLPMTVKIPKFELRVDSANKDISKQIVQGVSGVAGDIMDVSDSDIPFFVNVGLLEDVTEEGIESGFDPSHTWQSIRAAMTVTDDHGNERQYAYPCNVYIAAAWVNKDVFREYGFEPPPIQWTFEEFEEYGKRFMEAANKGKSYNDIFFYSSVTLEEMLRSKGHSIFNETLTECTYDDPRSINVLKTLHRWKYKDNILPTDTDIKSFSSDTGYGGVQMQLFNSGNFAMLRLGRYGLIQFRIFNEDRARAGRGLLDLGFSESPHGGFRNAVAGARAGTVYAGGKHKDLAILFLAYLASEDYNLLIVDDADSLPPNPAYAELEEFRHPSKYPNEWEVHQPWADLDEIGICRSFSPYVLYRVAMNEINSMTQHYDTGQMSVEEAVKEAARRVNAEIQRTLKERPHLRARYETALERQAKIDEMVAVWKQIEQLESEGRQVPSELRDKAQKIPLSWIDNVFYRVYYAKKGWAQEHVTE